MNMELDAVPLFLGETFKNVDPIVASVLFSSPYHCSNSSAFIDGITGAYIVISSTVLSERCIFARGLGFFRRSMKSDRGIWQDEVSEQDKIDN